MAGDRVTDQVESVPMIDKVEESVVSRSGQYEGRRERVDDEKVLCYCRSNCGSSEMACCDLCSGWFHFLYNCTVI